MVCKRMNSPTIPGDGSFEHWLHGGHWLMVKSGIMLPSTYRTYPGLGDKNDRRTVLIDPCFQEEDLRIWLESRGYLNDRVERAIELAKKSHWEQRRDDGSPYLEQHIYPVAAMMLWTRALKGKLLDEYRSAFPENPAPNFSPHNLKDMVIVALLHDSLEDSDIDENILKEEFGERVYRMVKILTKKRPWEESYSMEEYMSKIINSSEEVRIVKLADRLNNIFCLQHTSEEKMRWYLDDTLRWYYPLAADTSVYYHLWYYRTLKSLGVI